MSKITGNEPAVGYSIPQNFDNYYDGMTIRQRFAMAAMQGIVGGYMNSPRPLTEIDQIPIDAAIWSVKFADTLINELNKSEK